MGSRIVVQCSPDSRPRVASITFLASIKPAMLVIACAAPKGAIEPAPLTSLPVAAFDDSSAELAGFWASDDAYYVRARTESGANRWFRIESGLDAGAIADLATDALKAAGIAGMVADGGPRQGGVAFPAGSAGRTVFRVWRAKGADRMGRTRILGVRAGRSRRLPA